MLINIYVSTVEEKRRQITLRLEDEIFSKLDLSEDLGNETNKQNQE